MAEPGKVAATLHLLKGRQTMYPWEYARNRIADHPSADAQSILTEQELARLTKVRARYRGHPKCVEFALDERRLAFARWQVDRGWLREDR